VNRPTSADMAPAMSAARAALEADGFEPIAVVVTAVLPNGAASWVISSDPGRDPGDWTPSLAAASLEHVAQGIRAREKPVERHSDAQSDARPDTPVSPGGKP